MRWLSFVRNGEATFGFITADGAGVVDVGAHCDVADLESALAGDALTDVANRAGDVADLPLEKVIYLPPIPRPDKILCAGVNYRAHLEETGRKPTASPTLFTRFANSQIGHEQPMIRPLESRQFDFEGEIALIIGKPGRRVDRSDAMDHVAGFSIYNDGSVRDFQRATSQFTPGKNFVGTGGFGPWMMTPDEVGDLRRMELTTRLNGEIMQRATSDLLIFGFEELISYCSTFTELVPGDVIVTGTPGGVGAARTPPVFMKAGDVIEVEVTPIGRLRHTIADG